MQLIRTLLLGAALAASFVAGPAAGAPAEPNNGVQYLTLPEAQPTSSGNKVEVTEFFAYYCPHCNAFEPLLDAWVKKQGDNIVFKRVHVSLDARTLPQQRLFYTLDALGLVEQYHAKVFAAMHQQRLRLASDEQVFDWAEQAGIERARFIAAYRSFGVQAKLRRADALMSAYRIGEWPMVAIDGRYLTSPSRAGEGLPAPQGELPLQQAALQVMDYLAAKAKAEKK